MSLERLLRFAKNMLAPLGLASIAGCAAAQYSSQVQEPQPVPDTVVAEGHFLPSDWTSLFGRKPMLACMENDSILHCALILNWDKAAMNSYCGGRRPYCVDFHDGEIVSEEAVASLRSRGVAVIKARDDEGRPVYSTLPELRVICKETGYDAALDRGVLEENPLLQMMRQGQFPY